MLKERRRMYKECKNAIGNKVQNSNYIWGRWGRISGKGYWWRRESGKSGLWLGCAVLMMGCWRRVSPLWNENGASDSIRAGDIGVLVTQKILPHRKKERWYNWTD
jgi:hypothetical protein